jgi:hydroxymethylpyrimidine/phosphomethylpyrimidine kinase
VTAVSASSKDFMRAQLEAVLGDIGTDALKTGMIPSVELASVRDL